MKKFAAIAIAAVAIGGWASEARADLLIQASTDGITYTTLCAVIASPSTDPSCAVASFTAGNITIKVEGAEANQTSTLSQVLSSATSLTNNGTSTSTLYLQIVGSGFTSPIGDATLASQIGGSITTGSDANLLSYTSCVSASNDATCTQSTSALSPAITATNSSYNASNDIAVTGLAAPFAVVENIVFTLGAGSKLNYSASSTLTPVPEPVTTALFGVGLLGVASKARRRLGGRA